MIKLACICILPLLFWGGFESSIAHSQEPNFGPSITRLRTGETFSSDDISTIRSFNSELESVLVSCVEILRKRSQEHSKEDLDDYVNQAKESLTRRLQLESRFPGLLLGNRNHNFTPTTGRLRTRFKRSIDSLTKFKNQIASESNQGNKWERLLKLASKDIGWVSEKLIEIELSQERKNWPEPLVKREMLAKDIATQIKNNRTPSNKLIEDISEYQQEFVRYLMTGDSKRMKSKEQINTAEVYQQLMKLIRNKRLRHPIFVLMSHQVNHSEPGVRATARKIVSYLGNKYPEFSLELLTLLRDIQSVEADRKVSDQVAQQIAQLEKLAVSKAEPTKFNFISRVDVNPSTQSEAERTNTLRSKMIDAANLLKASPKQFVETFVLPQHIVDAAASDGDSVDFAANELAQTYSSDYGKFVTQQLQLDAQTKPTWLLGGKCAIAGNTVAYYDNHWYFLTLRQPIRSVENKILTTLDFFKADSRFPKQEFSEKDPIEIRLESLRTTQNKAIELLRSGDVKGVLHNVFCPFGSINRLAHDKNLPDDSKDIYAAFASPRGLKNLEKLAQEIELQMKMNPKWWINGTYAVYETDPTSSKYHAWHLNNGRWRLITPGG